MKSPDALDAARTLSRAQEERIDEAALETPGIDTFASSAAWSRAAIEAFYPRVERVFVDLGDALFNGVVLEMPPGRALSGCDAVWCLGCPLLGDSVSRRLDELLNEIFERTGRIEFLALGGIPRGPWFDELLSCSKRGFRASMNEPPIARSVASLKGGFDGFLGRRTRKHRANLRRASRLASERGVVLRRVDPGVDDSEEIVRRVLQIERRSWKGLTGQGAADGPMRHFIEALLRDSMEKRRLRLIFAELDGEDVGYLHGVVFGETFRGLQVSFDNAHASLGLGNIMQLEMIRWLTDQSDVSSYDLGAELPYKLLWADPTPALDIFVELDPDAMKHVVV